MNIRETEILEYLVTEEENLREGISYSVRKKDLIELGEQEELPVTAHYDGNSHSGYYRRLENHLGTNCPSSRFSISS